MKEFYYYDGQEQKGPLTIEELKRLPVKRETRLWCQGMPEWKRAEELEIFKEFFLSIPPPMSSSPTSPSTNNSASNSSKNSKSTIKIIVGIVIAVALALGVYGY